MIAPHIRSRFVYVANRDEPDYADQHKPGAVRRDFMSDISINIAWWELLIISPLLGWPGAIAGGLLGALLWRKRPILGGVIGAVAGNLALAAARFFMM
jgi:hypothetical protein